MRDPVLLSNPGQLSGIHIRFGALAARVANLEASRGYINGLDGSVLAPGTIDGSSISAGSITTGAIAAGAITADLIAAGAINAGHIAAGAITADLIAAGAISAGHIQANAIQAGHIGAGTITATHIAAGTITAQQIAANTITSGQIAAGTITATQIASGTITASRIAAGTITANELAANSISATHIQANAVTATAIGADSIYTNAIQAGAVTAAKVTVSTLAALTSNMGAITAGTITGATFQTSASGSRVVMDSLGMRGYALDGVTKVFEINSGSGVASFTGIANIDPLSVIPGQTITANTMPGDRIVAASIGTAQLAAGSVVANTIAAGAVVASKISVEFGGNNILYNSSFEDSVAMNNWGVYEGYPTTPTVVSLAESPTGVVARDGTKVCRVERLGSSTGATYASGTYGSGTYAGPAGGAGHAGIYQAQKMLPGQTYTMSIYAMIPSSRVAQVIRLYVNDGLATGGYWASSTTYNVPNDGVWRRYSYTFTYSPWGNPSNATTNVNVFFWMENAPTNAFIYLDGAQVEPGEFALAYARRPGEVLTGEIGSTKITPNSITTNEIMAATIQGSDIAATTLTAANIQGSTITADKLFITNLSAISGDLGTITAGTITGGTIRTAASDTRIQLDATGFKQFIGASATPAVHFKTDGTDTNTFTGTVQARGVEFLTAPYTGNPASIEKVRWMNGASEIARVYASQSNLISVDARSNSGTKYSRLDLQQEAGGAGTGYIRAVVTKAVGDNNFLLLDHDGKSDWVLRSHDIALRTTQSGAEQLSATFTTTVEPVRSTGSTVRMTITPAVNCWVESYYTLAISASDAAAVRCDAWVEVMTGTTNDGVVRGAREIVVNNATEGIVTVPVLGLFKLTAGVTYTIRAFLTRISGTWAYWQGPEYFQGYSKVVGYW